MHLEDHKPVMQIERETGIRNGLVCQWKHLEWTLLLDTFDNEILAHCFTDVPGSNKPHYDCMDGDLLQVL